MKDMMLPFLLTVCLWVVLYFEIKYLVKKRDKENRAK